jgi:hypothetical protein
MLGFQISAEKVTAMSVSAKVVAMILPLTETTKRLTIAR